MTALIYSVENQYAAIIPLISHCRSTKEIEGQINNIFHEMPVLWNAAWLSPIERKRKIATDIPPKYIDDIPEFRDLHKMTMSDVLDDGWEWGGKANTFTTGGGDALAPLM